MKIPGNELWRRPRLEWENEKNNKRNKQNDARPNLEVVKGVVSSVLVGVHEWLATGIEAQIVA